MIYNLLFIVIRYNHDIELIIIKIMRVSVSYFFILKHQSSVEHWTGLRQVKAEPGNSNCRSRLKTRVKVKLKVKNTPTVVQLGIQSLTLTRTINHSLTQSITY